MRTYAFPKTFGTILKSDFISQRVLDLVWILAWMPAFAVSTLLTQTEGITNWYLSLISLSFILYLCGPKIGTEDLMALYDFSQSQDYISMDKQPDHRSDQERLNSPLSTYNHDSPDLAWAERTIEEMINLSGAWITVYKRGRNLANQDEVWEEDADPVYSRGIKVKGFFAPAPAESLLSRYGVDTPNQFAIFFSRAAIIQQFGAKMVAEGDVLTVPHNTMSVAQNVDVRDGPSNRIDQYRVIKSNDVGNFKYRWLFWKTECELLLGDKTIEVEFRQENS